MKHHPRRRPPPEDFTPWETPPPVGYTPWAEKLRTLLTGNRPKWLDPATFLPKSPKLAVGNLFGVLVLLTLLLGAFWSIVATALRHVFKKARHLRLRRQNLP